MIKVQVYIYRHAMMNSSRKGVSKDQGPGLSETGIRQVRNLGPIVTKLGISPETIMTSPLNRAKETASLANELFWGNSKIITTEALLPNGDPTILYKELNSLDSENQVVVVTHYPLIKKLISDVLGYEFSSELLNGSVMRVDFQGKVSSGKGKLISIITPSERDSA